MNDLIRREDAISMLKELRVIESDNFTKIDPVTMMIAATIADCIEGIVELPSAESERMAKVFMDLRCVNGIAYHQYICSACDKSLNIPEVGKSPDWKPKYCVNCGARLEWE